MSNATIIFLIIGSLALLGVVGTYLFDRGHHHKKV